MLILITLLITVINIKANVSTNTLDTVSMKTKAERKAFEQKILGLIAEKQEDSLKGKSIEELTAILNA